MALFDNLVDYWKFDENTGSTVWDYTWWNTWTVTGMTRTTGKINSCGSFNWTSNFVALTDWANATMSSNAWTISYWMYKNANASSILAAIIANDWSTWNRQFAMWINTSWGFYFERNWTQVSSWWTTMSNSVWYHIVVTYDWTNLISYINAGTANTTAGMSALPSTANALYFGKRNYTWSEKYYNWRLDEVGIWSRVLSSAEITELYNWWAWIQPTAWAQSSFLSFL